MKRSVGGMAMQDIINAISVVGFPAVIALLLLNFTLKNYNKLQDKVIDEKKDSTK